MPENHKQAYTHTHNMQISNTSMLDIDIISLSNLQGSLTYKSEYDILISISEVRYLCQTSDIYIGG